MKRAYLLMIQAQFDPGLKQQGSISWLCFPWVDSFFCHHMSQPLLSPGSFKLSTTAAGIRHVLHQLRRVQVPIFPANSQRPLWLDPFRSQAIPKVMMVLSVRGSADGLKLRGAHPWKVGPLPQDSEIWGPIGREKGQQPKTVHDGGKGNK